MISRFFYPQHISPTLLKSPSTSRWRAVHLADGGRSAGSSRDCVYVHRRLMVFRFKVRQQSKIPETGKKNNIPVVGDDDTPTLLLPTTVKGFLFRPIPADAFAESNRGVASTLPLIIIGHLKLSRVCSTNKQQRPRMVSE